MMNTEPGQPLARSGGAQYYAPTQPGASSINPDGWWSGAGGSSPGGPMFAAPPTVSGNPNYPRSNERPLSDPPRPETIQGAGSRKTWDTSQHDQTNFVLGSVGGRPVYANVQVWDRIEVGPHGSLVIKAQSRITTDDVC